MNALQFFFLAGVALLAWQTWKLTEAALNAAHQRRVDSRWNDAFIARENAKRAGRDRWGRFKTQQTLKLKHIWKSQ
jgi:hypothetical protein